MHGLPFASFRTVVDGHQELVGVRRRFLLAGQAPAVERADFGGVRAAVDLVRSVAEAAGTVPAQLAIDVDRRESEELVHPAIARGAVLAVAEPVEEKLLPIGRAVGELRTRTDQEDGTELLGASDDEALEGVVVAVAVEVVGARGDLGEGVGADVPGVVGGRLHLAADGEGEDENDGKGTHGELLRGNEDVNETERKKRRSGRIPECCF